MPETESESIFWIQGKDSGVWGYRRRRSLIRYFGFGVKAPESGDIAGDGVGFDILDSESRLWSRYFGFRVKTPESGDFAGDGVGIKTPEFGVFAEGGSKTTNFICWIRNQDSGVLSLGFLPEAEAKSIFKIYLKQLKIIFKK